MDIFSPSKDFFSNPYPYYKEIRESKRPFFLKHDTGTLTDGIWFFGGYNDSVEIFKEQKRISKNISAVRKKKIATPFDLAMLHQDGEDHLRLRRLVAKYFASTHIKTFSKKIETCASKLISTFKKNSSIDLIADFSEPLPLNIISSLIGIPIDDMPQIRAWSKKLVDSFDSILASSKTSTSNKAMNDFMTYIEQLLCSRQNESKKNSDDFIHYLISAQSNEKISKNEVVGMIGFLLFAGHETTINLIGNGLWLLLSHYDQFTLLKQKPELINSAIEEILRFESPEQRSSFRIVSQPLSIAGMSFEPGQQIGTIIGSANRDGSIFPEPDVFNIQRTPNNHLAFGLGLHNCLGKFLARLEAKIALTCIHQLCPTLQLERPNAPDWSKNSFFRGLKTLMVKI